METPEFSQSTTHVTVPLAWFNQVLEVYYAAKADRLVPKQEPAPLPEGPTTEKVNTFLPPGTKLVTSDIPDGYIPKGAAAPKEESLTKPKLDLNNPHPTTHSPSEDGEGPVAS